MFSQTTTLEAPIAAFGFMTAALHFCSQPDYCTKGWQELLIEDLTTHMSIFQASCSAHLSSHGYSQNVDMATLTLVLGGIHYA
jgi:hypothetical protein